MERKIRLKLQTCSPRCCPECDQETGYINVLMLLGIQRDGYVCKRSKSYFDEIDGELKKLAVVIWHEEIQAL